MWREPDQSQAAPTCDWRGAIEHIQSGRRWTFTTLDEMMDLWRQKLLGSQMLDDLAPAGNESDQAYHSRRVRNE
jgi:hypothetical protein